MRDVLQGCHLYPKWVVDSWDHLMHARKVSEERPKSLSVQERGERLTVEPNELESIWNGKWKRENALGMPKCSGD